MTITINNKLEVRTNYKGESGLFLGMLGAIRYSEEWCCKQLQLQLRENHLQDGKESNHNECIHMSRDEALKALYDAYQSLQMRIGAITASSEQATFQIPTSIKNI